MKAEMRATKPRRLMVAGKVWCWRVRREPDCYPGYVAVHICLEDQGRGAARLDVRVRFDDPWLNYGPMLTAMAYAPERFNEVFDLCPVTPKIVASMIEQARARGWDPNDRGSTLSARWNDGVLVLPSAESVSCSPD
jgi:hypothetical protein